MPEAPRVILPQLPPCQPHNPSFLTHLGPEAVASVGPLWLQGRNWARVLRLSLKPRNLRQPLGQVPQQPGGHLVKVLEEGAVLEPALGAGAREIGGTWTSPTSTPTSIHLHPKSSSSVCPPHLRARHTQSNMSYF